MYLFLFVQKNRVIKFNVREKISVIFNELEIKEKFNLIEIDSTPNGQALTLKKALSKINYLEIP